MSAVKRHPLAFLAGVLFVALAVTSGFVLAPLASGEPGSTYGYLKLFSEVLTLIRHNYVEQVPADELLQGAYKGLLASLDGESEYMTADQYRTMSREKDRAGNQAQAGIYLVREGDLLLIASVLPGSDAFAKKLRLGDQIRKIDDKPGRGMTLTEAYRLLRGSEGRKIRLSVARREEPRREDIEVALQEVQLPAPSLENAGDGVAVVKVPAFGPGSASALERILGELHGLQTRRIVLDLRGNAWGSPDEAVQAASLFAGAGVLAKVVDRAGEERAVLGKGPRASWRGDVLLLTDPGTAFAAELFTAALVDKGLAKHGGESTLGRGGEREILPLANGDYLYLTVREYVSPSGTAWHGDGLKPAVVIPQDRSVPFEERASAQLRKAIEWMRELPAEAEAA